MTYFLERESRLTDHLIGPLAGLVETYAGPLTRAEALISLLTPGPMSFRVRPWVTTVTYTLYYGEYVTMTRSGLEDAQVHIDLALDVCAMSARNEINKGTAYTSGWTQLHRAIDRYAAPTI